MKQPILSPTTFSEKVLFSTFLIKVFSKDSIIATGTAFLFSRKIDEFSQKIYLITNNHVVENSEYCKVTMLEGTSNDSLENTGRKIDLKIPTPNFRYHIKEDLCIADITDSLMMLINSGKFPLFQCLNRSILPTLETIRNLSASENIMMIGCPTGLWDDNNNLPILRRGSTASHPFVNFQGRREILIDMACFPGSSGSPVFLLDDGPFQTKQGIGVGGRVIFLGVLYAGPTFDANGDVIRCQIPAKIKTNTVLTIHLGFIIKSEVVDELCEDVFMQAFKNTRA